MANNDQNLGIDIFFNGNLVVGPKGDYLEMDGVENLRRSILHRLITSPGEYRLNPSYGAGVRAFVKKPITKSSIDRLTQQITDQVLRDRRVEKVLDVAVTEADFSGQAGISVLVRIQAFGREIRFSPFQFTREL